MQELQTAAAININNQAVLEEAAQAFIYLNTKSPGDAISFLFMLKKDKKSLELGTYTLLIYYTTHFSKDE